MNEYNYGPLEHGLAGGEFGDGDEQPRPEQAGGETTGECGFDEAWIGKCKQIGNPRCAKHTGRVCVSCRADAVRNCEETGQFVCGADLCGDCEHTIFPSGTNGGIGFNAQSLPEGMSRHCRKTEQRFKPWYARDDNEDDDAPAAPERGDVLESQEFYELMQAYRHAGITDQDQVVAAFEAVKTYIHEQHSILIEQRERLIEALQLAVDWMQGKRGEPSEGLLAAQVMKRLEAVLTTIEQEGTTR